MVEKGVREGGGALAPGEPALSARVRVSPSGRSGARASKGGFPTAICSCSGLHVHESSCMSQQKAKSLNHINSLEELHGHFAVIVATQSHFASWVAQEWLAGSLHCHLSLLCCMATGCKTLGRRTHFITANGSDIRILQELHALDSSVS